MNDDELIKNKIHSFDCNLESFLIKELEEYIVALNSEIKK